MILNVYVPNNRDYKYKKQKQMELKRETNSQDLEILMPSSQLFI